MSDLDGVKLTERQWALTAAAQAFCNRGITIACPWEGDLDDEERERFDALVAAVDSYNAALSPTPEAPGTGGAWQETVEAALTDWGFSDVTAESLARHIAKAIASLATPAETQADEVGK